MKYAFLLPAALLIFAPITGFAAEPVSDFTADELKELQRLEELLEESGTAPAPAKDDSAAEEKRKQEAVQKAAEKKRKQEAARKAAEEKRKKEAVRKAAEEKRKKEAVQKAAEEKRKQEAVQKAAEEKRKQEAVQKAAEEKRKQEAARKAAEGKRKQEAAKKAPEEKRKKEAEESKGGAPSPSDIQFLEAEIGILKIKQAAMARKLQETEAKIKKLKTVEVGGLNFSLGGNLETKLSYIGKDIADDSSDSTIMLLASAVEIGLETQIGDLATGSIVFLTEDIGDEDAGGEVLIDEAIITLKKEGKPLYAVFGSRTQPFGAFYTHTINDPITQDLYEIGAVGVTVGAELSKGDVSLTIYRGQGHGDHLLESGHYNNNADDLAWTAMTDAINSPASIILSGQFSIIEALNVGLSYSTEKGEESSNATFGINMDYARGKWVLELEYIMALSRDKYYGATKEYKESAGSLGFSFAASDALEIAGRYELLSMGDLVDDLNGWALSNVIVIGANYTIFSDDEKGTDIYTAAEFRSFSYDVDSSLSTRADSNTELTVVLGIDF